MRAPGSHVLTVTANLRWTSTAKTHVGRIRTHNEDACVDLSERGIWAVADGMGGHAAGEFASRMIVDALASIPPVDSVGLMVGEVRQCLQTVNRRLCDEARRRREQVIGSTVVVLLALADHAILIWAGDSRAYRYQQGRFQRLTRDHSRVEDMVSQGLITREQAETHPAANIITRAVGVADFLELDCEVVEVEDGDIFLLCSDGLYKEVTEAEIGRILAIGDDRKACNLLLERALERGARDNVSVVVVNVLDTATLTKTQWNPSFAAELRSQPEADDPTKLK